MKNASMACLYSKEKDAGSPHACSNDSEGVVRRNADWLRPSPTSSRATNWYRTRLRVIRPLFPARNVEKITNPGCAFRRRAQVGEFFLIADWFSFMSGLHPTNRDSPLSGKSMAALCGLVCAGVSWSKGSLHERRAKQPAWKSRSVALGHLNGL
jgi:hypothetical protein